MTSNEEEFYREWEKHIQKVYVSFKNHLEIFNHDIDIQIGQQHAKEYAQMAIKHLFLLNGGALVASPAIIAAFNLPPNINVWISGVSFSLGLVLIILVSLFAYWSVANMLQALHADKFKNYNIFFLQNMRPVLLQETITEQEKMKLHYEKENIRRTKIANLWEAAAIASGILSLGAFICGTITLTNVVWDLSPTGIESITSSNSN